METRYRIEILALGFDRRQFLAIQERSIEIKLVLTENSDMAQLFPTEDAALAVARIFTRMDCFFRIQPVHNYN
jgi:hypothetical protein